MQKRIIVFGGDGYIGWPLSVQLAIENKNIEVLMIDSLLRRKLVNSCGSDSLTNILMPNDRIKFASDFFGINNLNFKKRDISEEHIDDLFLNCEIVAIYNLAQQASAPFSMKNLENAILTTKNNEIANLKVLFSMKKYCPNAHLIKLGSFGEYSKTNIDISEGFFKPTFNGITSDKLMPYPRASSDFYHASKINDSNYINVACSNWGLKVIEIMQSTVFGVNTSFTKDTNLQTRFDYDQFFGTVVNRFVVEAVLNIPLTVYGTGHQRTGLMALEDSVQSLSKLWKKEFKDNHKIINHVTEKNFSVLEIANIIREIAKKEGYICDINHEFDPRYERIKEKQDYKILTDYVSHNCESSDFETVVREIFQVVKKNVLKLKKEIIEPSNVW